MIAWWAAPFLYLGACVLVWWVARVVIGWAYQRSLRQQVYQGQRWGSREFDRNHRPNSRRDV